ncbi:ABC transporter permease [Jatrophihabitans cynanchi]|uniref:ABC transporter permease n=1 Tax=Jatrophihabitans cynanchi TaxID=2944128 RepID=A0ABY7JWT0_9ACTN|nr:ABC transporter permease [Jatrophihabitans sp. SB3-54]WAX57027.1 ABC transporter permease [Jatrophihabitans sp. SB3-54]
MNAFLAYTFTGLFTGAAYAIAASGLVLTYTTTRVFNLAHGAISMVMAYLYWQLTHQAHLPSLAAVALILLVIAPASGIVIERVMMRDLGDAPVSVSLVVTVGLFVLLIGLAQQFWPSDVGRNVPQFFGFDAVSIGTFRLSYHYILTIVVSAAVAAALYVLLNRTRTGTAMRASVDNKELLQLFGSSADRVSMASWAIGSSLAALAGILLVSVVQLNYYDLTFLVINAFAAAMFGRLQHLPLTYLGAIVLGLGQTYVQGYLPSGELLLGFRDALPTIVLFAVLIFVPQVRLRVGQIRGILAAPVPTRRRTAEVAVGLVIAVTVVGQFLGATNQLRLGDALAFGIVMLSLVLLTGYGGYVSLAQLSFMGIGAAVVCKLDTSSPLAVLAAALIAAAVGALVALPVLRLTGLYLALATFAFAQLMDKLVFQASFMFGFNGSLNAKPVSLFGYRFDNANRYVFLLVVVFTLIAIGLLALRRGPVGRVLIAMRDSPAACGTLGLNQRWFRVGLFSLAAAIAGVGGGLVAGLRGTVSQQDFQALSGLLLLLLAVVCGATSMTGAFLGGLLLMLLPVLQSQFPALGGLEFLIIGVGAVSLGRDPNGLANLLFTAGRAIRRRIPRLSGSGPAGSPADAPVHSTAREQERVISHGLA